MSEFETRTMRPQAGAEAQAIDQGLRAFMISVYQYMMLGVAITGGIAYFVSTSPTVYEFLASNGLIVIAPFAALGILLWISFTARTMSAATAQFAFWALSATYGIFFGAIVLRYPVEDIARVFFITSATFGALSLYGYTTSRSLSGWGSFLFMGLIGIILASIVNIFLGSSAMTFAISVIGVLVFSGLTAYDTQTIKEMYFEGDDGEMMSKKAIHGALALYLDFINLFLYLLRLLGSSRD